MSAFKDFNFIKEFACRTQLNYYRLKLEQSNKNDDKAKVQRHIRNIESLMKERNYSVSNYYEVTQLINSLIGLLVFPQQGYYDTLRDKENESRREMKTLYDYIKSGPQVGVYTNTYCENNRKVYNVLRHMRNATCHNRMGVYPESANGKDITHVCFRDEKENEHFELIIKVEDLEKVLVEISGFIIDLPV